MNWQTKKLGEVCDIYQPKTISAKDMVIDGKYVVFGANGVIGRYDKYNHEKPQLLITCRGATCGSVNISSPKSWITGNAMVVQPKDTSLDLNYLEYMFRGGLDMHKVITGAAQPQITRSNLEPIEISYPNISEQKRIVKVLDEVFENIDKAKENTEKNLQNSKELFENYLQNIFINNKWGKLTLKEISSTFARGKSKHRPRNDKKLYGGKFPFIQTGDIRNSNHYITKYTQTYNETGLAQSKLWPAGTICITIAANIAETGILTFDACFPDSVIGIVPNSKIAHNQYVEYLLESYKTIIQARGKGSAQANINMATFENEYFPFPDIETQKEIVKKLDKLSQQTKKLEENYKQKLLLLDELKKSVLQKAFSGNL